MPAASIVSGPKLNPANQHVYTLFRLVPYASGDSGYKDPSSAYVSWTHVEWLATSKGGYLATINDSSENEWVRATFGSHSSWYIGLSDTDHDEVFSWANGESPEFPYPWTAGEVRNLDGSEDFVLMSGTDGTWTAASGWPAVYSDPATGAESLELRVLVEMIPAAPSIITDVHLQDGHYYFGVSGTSWKDCELSAQILGGHLVTINSEVESLWLASKFNSMSQPAIGVYRPAGPDPFTLEPPAWISGEPLSWTHWDIGQPTTDLCPEWFGFMCFECDSAWYLGGDWMGTSGIVETSVPPPGFNHAPVADASQTPIDLISSNGVDAPALLVGAATDPDEGDLENLTYHWTVTKRVPAGSPPAETQHYDGTMVFLTLAIGTYEVVLTVYDGSASDTDSIELVVNTSEQAVQEVENFVASFGANAVPAQVSDSLLTSLAQAEASFASSSTTAGINQLGAFQNKVSAALKAGKINTETANSLYQAAQRVIDSQTP